MEVLIIILVIAIVVIAFRIASRKSGASGSSQVDSSPSSEQRETAPPRDYLAEADSFLEPPKPLSDLYREDPVGVLKWLHDEATEAGTMIRKVAVYALGQIGNPESLHVLQHVATNDAASGVRDAAKAAVAAIRSAPETEGFDEMARRKIIKRVYDGLG